jgi:hypothetical protein
VRADDPVEPVAIGVDRFVILVASRPPERPYRAHARLVEEFTTDDDRTVAGYCFIAVGTRAGGWPQLVVSLRYSPAGYGFAPGVLLVPETGRLFIGAGARLLGYRVDEAGTWQRSFVDEAEVGFLYWQQHGDVVLMAAELELAAWTTTGEKLWRTFVEPPWSYELAGDEVHLDVMGARTSFPKRTGPKLA